MEPKTKSVNVYVSEEAHRVVRKYRVEGGMTIKAIVEQALLTFDRVQQEGRAV